MRRDLLLSLAQQTGIHAVPEDGVVDGLLPGAARFSEIDRRPAVGGSRFGERGPRNLVNIHPGLPKGP